MGILPMPFAALLHTHVRDAHATHMPLGKQYDHPQ